MFPPGEGGPPGRPALVPCCLFRTRHTPHKNLWKLETLISENLWNLWHMSEFGTTEWFLRHGVWEWHTVTDSLKYLCFARHWWWTASYVCTPCSPAQSEQNKDYHPFGPGRTSMCNLETQNVILLVLRLAAELLEVLEGHSSAHTPCRWLFRGLWGCSSGVVSTLGGWNFLPYLFSPFFTSFISFSYYMFFISLKYIGMFRSSLSYFFVFSRPTLSYLLRR